MSTIIAVLQVAVLFWLTFGLPVIMRHYYYLKYNWFVWGFIVPMGCIIVNNMLINFFVRIRIFFKKNKCSEKEIYIKGQKAVNDSFRSQIIFTLLTWVMWIGHKFFN